MHKANLGWQNISNVQSRSYTCGFCGNRLASEKGFTAELLGRSRVAPFIYICHFCDRPTYFDQNGSQTPGSPYGPDVVDISDDKVDLLYNEARRCISSSSYTAAVLCCRKLLMHIAVSKGAKKGQNFVDYVDFLIKKNFVPPDSEDWIDHIRKKGNEANHEIALMKQKDAEELIDFIAILLKMLYEFPTAMRKKIQPQNQ